MEFSFNLPIAIEFGRGASKKVGEIAKLKGWKRSVIITDKGVVKAGLLEGIKASLEGADVEYEVWDKVVPNPTDVSVEEAAKFVEEYKADFIVAVGGAVSPGGLSLHLRAPNVLAWNTELYYEMD